MAEINNVIAEASQDLQTIEDFVNLPAGSDVRPRLLPSVNVGTLAGIRDAIFEAGGLPATPFTTKALMTASALVDGNYAMVTDDTVNNGLYVKTAGTWVKSAYDPVLQSKDYVSKTGYGSIIATAEANINYTTADRVLTLASTVLVFSGTQKYQLATPQTISLPANTLYRLDFEIATGLVKARSYSHERTEGEIIIGFIEAFSGGIKSKDFRFTINGLSLEQSKTATLHGDDKSVSINTDTGLLKFTSVRVITDNGLSKTVTQDLDFSSIKTSPATRYLLYNIDDNVFSIESSIFNVQSRNNMRLIASFIPATGEIRGLGQPYRRNGPVVGGAPTTNTGILLSTSDNLDFKFATNEITISEELQVLHGSFRFKIEPQTVDIAPYASSLWYALVADIKDWFGIISVIPTNAAYSKDLVILGAFRKDIKAVANIDSYAIDGVSNNSGGSVTPVEPVSAKLPSLGWSLDGVYTAPTMPAYRSSGADPLRAIDVTSTIIDNWFDSLVAAHPDYITKTHMGDEYTGLPINEYRFKPDMGGSTKPIKILIHGGTHGEPMSYLLPYHAMKLIADNWQDDPLLEALRFGVEFSVIPAVNAWGITNGNDRYNSRGININRNYPVDWVSTGDNPGTEPLSELEAQYAYANMTAFKPHVALDIHSFGTTEAGDFLWMTVESSPEAISVGSSMINRMRQKWVKETPDILLASELDRNGEAISMGSTVRTMKEMGAISLTFECGTKILGEQPLAEHYSELSVRYGVEALINYLIIMLRRNA